MPPFPRFRADLRKEALILLRDRKALLVAGLIPILTIWAYSFVEPPAEVRFDEQIFRTTDPTALVVSLAVMFPAFMMGSGSIVREKTAGTLRRLSETPMHTLEFVGAKLLVLFTVSFVQILLVLVVAMTVLDNITISNVVGFLLRAGLIGAAFVAVGLLVSAIAGSENQALALTTFAVLIMLVLSGFLAPMDQLGNAEPVARVLPYTHAYLGTYYFLKGLDAPEPYALYLVIDLTVAVAVTALVVHLYRRR